METLEPALKNTIRILWEKTSRLEARILRMYGSLPGISVPAYIDGVPVTELGDYCFAKTNRLPGHFLTTDLHYKNGCLQHAPDHFMQHTTELSGSYIRHLTLPKTMQKIGSYVFYDCRNLATLQFPACLSVIGSDAFMNCHSLHSLTVTCGPSEQTGLRQILAQIPWDVEVSFLYGKNPDGSQKKAAIFYPEYYVTYDEITPAHIFSQKLPGEGFRARQCFQNGIIDYVQYDTIFQKACAEESVQTVCRFALCRLRSPICLSDAKKTQYGHFIRLHGRMLCQTLTATRDLAALAFLFQEKLLHPQDAQYAITLAAQAGWGEGSASMQHWKQRCYQTEKSTRYEFDDF